MSNVKNATSLSVLSRAVINRNVKREDVDSLPLPRSLRDECFSHVAVDRFKESFRRNSTEPCQCGAFLENVSNFRSWIPRWTEKAKSDYGTHLTFLSELPGLLTRAEWLELPDRSTLTNRLRSSTATKRERERMRACLNTLRFDPTTGLGQVHEWIRQYLYYQDVHGWYHVSVNSEYMRKFLETAKNFDVVLLPYGCVTGGFGTERLRSTRNCRHMILAVRNDDGSFYRAIHPGESRCTAAKIRDAMHLAETIAFVSRPETHRNWPASSKNYFIFEPMIWHAWWWMLLLIPHGYSRQNCQRFSKLEIENCVVLLDPLYQCIGDPTETRYEDCSHVYWFDGQILNVKEIPDDVVHRDKKSFVNWCASREMNTLMNLNGNDWYRPPDLFYCTY